MYQIINNCVTNILISKLIRSYFEYFISKLIELINSDF